MCSSIKLNNTNNLSYKKVSASPLRHFWCEYEERPLSEWTASTRDAKFLFGEVAGRKGTTVEQQSDEQLKRLLNVLTEQCPAG